MKPSEPQQRDEEIAAHLTGESDTATNAPKRWVLNTPLLVCTLIVAVVLAGAAHRWRSHNVDRMAGALLEKAEAMEHGGDWEKAAQYLRQFLALRPHDPDGLARLAAVYDRPGLSASEKVRAIEPYYRAIGALGKDGRGDQRRRLRLRLAELLLEVSPVYRGASTRAERETRLLLEPSEASAAWQRVREGDPSLPPMPPEGEPWWMDHPKLWQDPQAARLWVLAVDRQIEDGSFAGSARPAQLFNGHFEEALKLNPGDIELSAVLSRLYRDRPELFAANEASLSDDERQRLAARNRERADAIQDQMVAAGPGSPRAFLTRHQYRVDYNLPGAAEDVHRALQLGPDDAAVLLAAAEHAKRDAARWKRDRATAAEADAKYAEATAFCRRAIRAAPSEESGYLLLGAICQAQGRNREAIEAWRQGLKACGQGSFALDARLIEALVADGQLQEAKKHLEAVERDAKKLAPLLESGSQWVLSGMSDLLRGEWLVGQGRYAEAIVLLKRVTAGNQDSGLGTAQIWQAWQLLGGVYAQLGQWDLAAAAHEAAAGLEPHQMPPETRTRTLLAAANAWSMAGRPDWAAGNLQKAVDLDDDPEIWLAVAAARLEHQRGLPPDQRTWDAFDDAIARANRGSETFSEPWRATLLEAEALAAKRRKNGSPQPSFDDAARRLREAERKYPESVPLLESLVLAFESLGLSGDADRAMDAVDRLAGPSVDARLLRSRLYRQRAQYDRARDVLSGGLDSLDPADRAELRMAMVQVSLDEGQTEAACRQLAELHASDPTDVRFVWQLAELALERDDFKEAARWEDELRRLEGPDGSYWRYVRGRRLVAESQDAVDPRLVEVGQLQTHLQSQRWAWPAVHVLAGLRFERLGRSEPAIAAYRKAIELGERRISVYQRLVGLLCQKRDFDQARRYLARLEDYVPLSRELSGMEISVSAQLGDNARALESARRGVDSRPDDPIARVWLGRMLFGNGKTEAAEAALTEAARLAPGDPRTAEAMFAFYADTGQKDRATEALKRLAACGEFSQAERLLTLAQGFERLNDPALAKRYLEEAAQQPGDDLASQKRLAAMLFDSDPEGAEAALRRARRLAPDDGEVRRALAVLLAARGGENEWHEVQRLIAGDGDGRHVPSEDRRLHAQLLIRRGGKVNVTKAKRLLEGLVRNPEIATAADHLLLAGLYEQENKPHLAEQQYKVVAERPEPEPSHLTAYVDFLLRHDRLREAGRGLDKLDELLANWLARLQRQTPDRAAAVRVAATLDAARLRARWLKAEGHTPQIKPLVDGVAEKLLEVVDGDRENEARVYSGIGDVYSAVEEYHEAEGWYGRLAEIQPDRYEPLIACLARQGRIGEAIQRCHEAATRDDSARPAIVMSMMLGSSRPTAEDFAAAEPLLAGAVQEHPDNADLLSNVAYVRFLQDRNAEAVRLYEQALAKRPDDLLVLNNLATLLAEVPARRKDALVRIERAIAIAGPKPGFLDVKGTILSLDGKADEAVPLLEEASSLSPDPRYDFHLAVAYQRSGDLPHAREALRKAREGNLNQRALTETDRRLLAELESRLAQ